ncbi:hypothetical protein STEG23_007562, partial [Scotinomys teguina]
MIDRYTTLSLVNRDRGQGKCSLHRIGTYQEEPGQMAEPQARGSVYLAALFVIARTWKQPRCPSTEEWIRKMWYIYTMEHYTAKKNNDIMKFAGKWMDLENVIQSEPNDVTYIQCKTFHISGNSLTNTQLEWIRKAEQKWGKAHPPETHFSYPDPTFKWIHSTLEEFHYLRTKCLNIDNIGQVEVRPSQFRDFLAHRLKVKNSTGVLKISSDDFLKLKSKRFSENHMMLNEVR